MPLSPLNASSNLMGKRGLPEAALKWVFVIHKGDKSRKFADNGESSTHLEPNSDQTSSKWELQMIENSEWYST